MGTTTNYAIPYPEPTDFVTDGAQAMENIAEKVDNILSTGAAARNLLYNGAMQITQRGTNSGNFTAAGYYTADRWRVQSPEVLNGTWLQTIETDVPSGSGFRQSLKMQCKSATPSLAGNNGVQIAQLLEGFDVQAIKKGTASAQQLTVSFWVKANLSGTYIFELYDADNTRQVSKSYVVNATATWEYKTINIPADTTGAFTNDNNLSLVCIWWLCAGANYSSGTLNTTWASVTNTNRAVGQVNLSATLDNYIQITGVQLTVGSVATPFEFKSYQQELRECQRYYVDAFTYLSQATGIGYGGASSYWFIAYWQCPVPMRTNPTVSGFTTSTLLFTNSVGNGANVTTILTSGSITPMRFYCIFNISGYTIGQAVNASMAGSANVIPVSAELV